MQHGTTKFRGRKEEEEILQFLVSFLPDRMVDLWAGNLDKFARPGLSGAKSWLVSFLLNILLNNLQHGLVIVFFDLSLIYLLDFTTVTQTR